MTEKRFLTLQDLSAYKQAFKLSNDIWAIVQKWNCFEKDTVGKQFVRSADSIAANIAEGFGRFTKKDKIHFYRYSYGSIEETIDWNEKARSRKLISEEQYTSNARVLRELPREVHYLIAFTNKSLTI